MHLGQFRPNAPGFNRRSVSDIMGNVKHTAPLERKRELHLFLLTYHPAGVGAFLTHRDQVKRFGSQSRGF